MSNHTTRRKAPAPRDGLGSATVALKGKTLPPRTHAIHVALYDRPEGLTREEIEQQLSDWGYEAVTVAVTSNHLGSLETGWGKNKIKAVRSSNGRYQLTDEARQLLRNATRYKFK